MEFYFGSGKIDNLKKKVRETKPRSQGFLLKDCLDLTEKPWEPGLGKQ